MALAALENALVLKAAQKPGFITPEVEKQFKTFEGIKARALRPGTADEGETATSIAIQRLVKMVYS